MHVLPGDIKTGFLEKRIGENSGRQKMLESMKWQKRYFVLTETKGMLYYFKSADDPPNYRGVINIRESLVWLTSCCQEQHINDVSAGFTDDRLSLPCTCKLQKHLSYL